MNMLCQLSLLILMPTIVFSQNLSLGDWSDVNTPLPLSIDRLEAIGFSHNGLFAYRYSMEQTETGPIVEQLRILELASNEENPALSLLKESRFQQTEVDTWKRTYNILAPGQHGAFPFTWNNNTYDIDIQETPNEIEIFLISNKQDRRLVARVSTNNQLPWIRRAGKTVKASYMKDPFGDNLVIVVGVPYRDMGDTEARRIQFVPFSVSLTK